MADYPNNIFDQRTIENVNGVVYDEANTKVVYAEDIQSLGDEVTAIEETLGENLSNVITEIEDYVDPIEEDLQLQIDDINIELPFLKNGDQGNIFSALGSSIKAISFDGSTINNQMPLTDGTIIFCPIWIPEDMLLTGVKFYQAVQGNYTADNNNVIALCSYTAGTLNPLVSTTNDGDLFKGTANTFITKAFSSPYAVQRGLYFLAILYNSSAQTTAPQIGRLGVSHNIGVQSYDFTNSAKLVCNSAGNASIGSSYAMSALTGQNNIPWVAVY